MSKQFVIRISYTDYAIDRRDAVALLDIASRMVAVKQNGYSGPYYIQPDQEPWLDTMSLSEVIEPDASNEPDVFSNATRGVSTDPIPF